MENIVSIMNGLDSPLEALALNYVSFGFLTIVNNLWTWLAVITAAVSFWRIKAAGTSCSVKSDPPPQQQPACFDRSSNGSSSTEPINEPPASIPAPATATVTSSLRCDVNDNGVTKGKFTMYYESESESENESEGELTVVNEWGYINGGDCGEWLERVMKMRMGDLGWYKCQDLTAINGNVVRLWDDECRSGGLVGGLC